MASVLLAVFHDVSVLFLLAGVPEKGKAFCEKVPFPEDALFLDPERAAYKELSLFEGVGRTFFALATPKVLPACLSNWANVLWL